MAQYAEGTAVPIEKTRNEIERALTRYGAAAFVYGWVGDLARIEFAARGRRVRFELPLPARTDRRFTHTPVSGRRRSDRDAERAWDQGCRQRWRALLLIIKAKLEAVESGITTFEDEWLSWTVLPDGRTVSEHTQPAVQRAYDTGQVAPLLALETGLNQENR